MRWSQILASLAAVGGLQGLSQVEAALREAAPSPERDYRQLIDMVRTALSAMINAGKLPDQRCYVGLEALYADRAVVELSGKYFQYPYKLQPVNGVEQVVFDAPTEVVETYVPVASGQQAAKERADFGFTAKESVNFYCQSLEDYCQSWCKSLPKAAPRHCCRADTPAIPPNRTTE